MGYIRIPIDFSPEDLAQEVFDYITSQAPGWQPQDGNLDVWIIRAVAQLASETKSLASDVQDDIFRWFGASLVGLQPLDAVSATGNTTWVLTDTVGHTIPAGTTVGIPDANGIIQGFQVDSDVTVPNGSSATSTGAVSIRAVVSGAAGTALGGASVDIQLLDVLDWVQTVTLTAATSGGQDAETDTAYLARLADKMRRLSQRPILPDDFAALAKDADSSIARVVAIDGYNPANQTFNNQRMIAIAAVDANGLDVSASVKQSIDNLLQANREINFIVNVMSPNYTQMNVNAVVATQIDFDTASVDAAAESALIAYFNPANWGQDPTVRESSTASTWVETDTVYYNNVLALISNVSGVANVISMTLNGGTSNVTIASPAGLTTPGGIDVSN